MELTRDQIADIAKSTAQTVLEGLHQYAVEYKEPETIEQGLQDSMIEERTAANWYDKRAQNAVEYCADDETAKLYLHIAEEEKQHYDELNVRLRQLEEEKTESTPSRKLADNAWLSNIKELYEVKEIPGIAPSMKVGDLVKTVEPIGGYGKLHKITKLYSGRLPGSSLDSTYADIEPIFGTKQGQTEVPTSYLNPITLENAKKYNGIPDNFRL